MPHETAQKIVDAAAQYSTDELSTHKTTSGKIRYLTACGLKKGAIVKILKYADGRPILYQHVYNVLKKPLKRTAVQKVVETIEVADETDAVVETLAELGVEGTEENDFTGSDVE
jgi:hypothetical protein